ncbi:TonB-dependent receptor [Parabacteroides sp. AM08-6]|uniref:TonB-dependent receptor n=1 Tax=Parabacteroides sp. AM08-6 TaxID=2292053 RepID=UPI000EFDC77D|nr:TonB-dependent receptor [Parabacteroides sp. AM08-6]RHJ86689.1 TonB-dependent receptor [Parabacteroides sp. AM08-6]
MKLFYYIIPFFLCFVHTAQGEENDTTNLRQVELDEVIIQSFKQRRDLRLEPLSASSVTGTAIENRNITGIKEFSSFIPNLFMPDYGSKLTSPVYIRGIGSKINAPSVGLYVDGIPYFEKSAFDFDFSDIERIEVLRGPQGTLYGRNTMGGIINVYTKSPLRYQGLNGWISNGNYGYRDYALSYYKSIGEKFGYALSGNYNRNDGYFTNLHTGQKADPQKSGSGRIRLEWKPRETLSFGLVSTFDYSNQGGYPYAVCDSATHKPGEVDYDAYSSYKRTLSTTGFTMEYRGKGYSLNSQTAFQYLSDHQGIDQDFSPKSIYFAKQEQKQKMVSEEFNIKSTTDSRYKWLFGAFGFWQGIDNTVIVDYLSAGYSSRKLYDTPTYGIAFYHQSTIDDLLTKGLSLSLGIRYDYERASTDYCSFQDKDEESKEVDSFYSKLKFSQVTPKASLRYLFPSSGMLYATVSKGYKTGGFNTSFEREEDRTFRPESSWNYEIGAKHPFLDNRLSAEIALFWIDWKNQQVSKSLPISQKGSMLNNAGRSESKGVEVSLQGNPVNGLMLQVNYGFTHATFKEYTDTKKTGDETIEIDYSGHYLPLVPSHTFAVGADYSIPKPCSHIDRVTISTNYAGTGRIHWKEDNRVSQSYYGQLNGKLSVTKGFVTFAIWAKNITNTNYTAFYFETGGKGLAQKGRPFTIGGNIQLSF